MDDGRAHPPGSEAPLRSFWIAGYEGADHCNAHGEPLDMAAATAHVARLDEDYRAAAALGLKTARESIGWRLAEPAPGVYDLARARLMAATAERHGLQLLWTLMHYGTPADVSLLDDRFVDRHAAYAAAVARALKGTGEAPPVYTPINEIGYLAWVVSETNQMHPYRGDPQQRRGGTAASGYEIKRRLVRGVLAAIEAIRSIDARARFLHIEPLVHVVAPRERPELAALAEQVRGYQWQAWDMIAGRADRELGGHAEALDLIGVNCYHDGQWEVATERRLHWHRRDPRRRPFAAQLQECWERYRRPLLVAETSHVGEGRAQWLDEIAAEVETARGRGVPVSGLCLYPAIDRHDWNDASHWHHSGLWDVVLPGAADAPAAAPDPRPRLAPAAPPPPLPRVLNAGYAATLARWQARLPQPLPAGPSMPTLIVFSHLRWSFVYQRPQHLLSRLARHYRVLFVEEPVRSDGPPRFERSTPAPGVEVLCPHTPVEACGFHDDQLPLLKPLLAEHLRAHGIADYLVWFYTPMALPLAAELRPRAVVYDCMDELAAFKDAPRQLRQRETALLRIAQLVFTGGPALYEAKRRLHPEVHCLPSAVDAEHYAPARLDGGCAEAQAARALQQGLAGPKLGYFGVIDERMNLGLVAALADARPDWQIVMAGPVVKIDPASLPRRPNIHWLGMQPYARLPYLVADWDVCLMPFALNASTRYISPTKTLEYMAAEKPVASTAVPDVVALYGDVVEVAHDTAGFIAACAALLGENGRARAKRVSAMLGTVTRVSWDSSAASVAHLLGQALARSAATPAALRELDGLAVAAEAPAAAAGAATPIAAPPGGAATARAPRRVQQLVIGAGPTGLACAHHLGRMAPDSRVLLVEREDRVGGWCRSIEQDGYTFDHAGHIMFSDDPGVLALYETLLGDNLHWQQREAWIWSKNTYTRYPFQGALHGLPPQVLKECLVGAIEARFGPLAGTGSANAARGATANFEAFIHATWGAGIAKHFAIPYNEKLWAVPLAEMETSWLAGRVPLPDLERMIQGALEPAPPPMGPNARFGYPLVGGFQALMDGFLPHLRCELALGTGVLHVSPARRTVRLDDGRSVRFDTLVSTMPLPRLVEACGDEAPAAVQAAAKALRHVAVRCVNLGIALPPGRERLTDKHWIYYPEDTVFHRIFVQGNASPHCNAPGGFALTCEISHGPAKPLPCDGAALIERVIADCRKVGIFGPDDRVLSAGQVDMPCAYVVYDHARAANVKTIRDWFASFGVVLAGRYAEWEYYNSDHAFIAGRRAAEQVLAGATAGEHVARAS